MKFTAVAGLVLWGLTAFAHASTDHVREWKFTVYLDDTQIGHHNYRVARSDDAQIVDIDARFKVKFLFITAYQYEHQNREVWSDGCLMTLESETDDNGKRYAVELASINDGIEVRRPEGTKRLQGCIRSFAYWDPALLTADKMINAQTGEYLDVEITALGPDSVEVSGTMTPASRYRLSAKDLTIDLWYSESREWLALDAPTGNGRLRYRIN